MPEKGIKIDSSGGEALEATCQTHTMDPAEPEDVQAVNAQ
jgi:hypothetical protein